MTTFGAVAAILANPLRALRGKGGSPHRGIPYSPASPAAPDAVTLRILTDFVGRPLYSHQDGDGESDVDVIGAYNLAVTAALRAIRRAAQGGGPLID